MTAVRHSESLVICSRHNVSFTQTNYSPAYT